MERRPARTALMARIRAHHEHSSAPYRSTSDINSTIKNVNSIRREIDRLDSICASYFKRMVLDVETIGFAFGNHLKYDEALDIAAMLTHEGYDVQTYGGSHFGGWRSTYSVYAQLDESRRFLKLLELADEQGNA